MNHAKLTADLHSVEEVDQLISALSSEEPLSDRLRLQIISVLRSYSTLRDRAIAAGNSAVVLNRVVTSILLAGEGEGRSPRIKIPAGAMEQVSSRMKEARPVYKVAEQGDGSHTITLRWESKDASDPGPSTMPTVE